MAALSCDGMLDTTGLCMVEVSHLHDEWLLTIACR